MELEMFSFFTFENNTVAFWFIFVHWYHQLCGAGAHALLHSISNNLIFFQLTLELDSLAIISPNILQFVTAAAVYCCGGYMNIGILCVIFGWQKLFSLRPGCAPKSWRYDYFCWTGEVHEHDVYVLCRTICQARVYSSSSQPLPTTVICSWTL